MGRVSKARSAEHRELIVRAAARLFRERGLGAVNIADIMAEAGLTHGGFYGHFSSKDALAGEAITLAFDQIARAWEQLEQEANIFNMELLAEAYLFSTHGSPCPMPALAFDIASAPPESLAVKAYSAGVNRLADIMKRQGNKDKGLALLAALIGARLLGLAIRDDVLAKKINAAVVSFARG